MGLSVEELQADWKATLKFSDSSAHSYTMSRDGDGILSFQTHISNNNAADASPFPRFDSVGFYGISESVNLTLDSNNTLTAITTPIPQLDTIPDIMNRDLSKHSTTVSNNLKQKNQT